MNLKKRMGFHKKLNFGILIVLAVMLLLMAVSSYLTVRNTLEKQVNAKVAATLEARAVEFDNWVCEEQNVISYYADSIIYGDFLNTKSKSELESFLASKKSDHVIDYYVVDSKAVTTFASGFVLPDDFDVTARDWYKDTIAHKGEFICTSPYIDNNTAKMVVTIAKAYYDGDTLQFVMGADIYADSLAEITKNVSLYDKAYPILADNDFNILVHKNEEYMPSISEDGSSTSVNLRDLECYSGIVEMLEGDSFTAVTTKDYDGKNTSFILSKISSVGWYYLYAIDRVEYINEMSAFAISQLVILLASLAVISLATGILMKRLLKPMDELKTAVQNMEQGNLNYVPSYYADDSISQLCEKLGDTNAVWLRYIDDITGNLDKLSHGDFNIEFNGDYVGDFAEIKQSIISISDSLQAIIGGIDTASSQVALGSGNVAETSNSLAGGVNEQSRTIDELTELIQSLVKQIESNAKAAEDAQKRSLVTSENVVECNNRMTELMESMRDIDEKAQEIVKIIAAIDDIAFQTNILALNAAVEAARAGDAGKGFAVVADEVRNLASKSAEAVKNTGDLINSTGIAVEKGTKLAAETDEALKVVSEGVERVNSLIMGISKASEVQAEEVKAVSDKITSIEEVVRFTASTAEESAASSEELSSQARTLQEMVLQFKGTK